MQTAFAASPARFKLVAAGRRSGKTAACAYELVKRSYRDLKDARLPRISEDFARLYWIVAPTYLLLRRPFDLVSLAIDRRLIVERRPRAVPPYIHLVGDIRIEGRSAEHPETLASEGLDGVWLDEAAVMRREVWQEVRPMLADRGGWGLFSSRPRGRNWFRDLWEHATPPEWARFAWTSLEGGWVAPEEIAEAERTMPPRWFRREFLASWEAFEGAVFETWDETRHTFTGPIDPRRYRRVVAGVDWGFRAPGAIVVVGVTADRTFDVLAEDVASGRTLDEWVARWRALRHEWHAARAWADPSEPASIQALASGGPCAPASNDLHAGIGRLAELLHGGRLRVHAGCPYTRRTMAAYRWRDSTRDVTSEEPAPGQEDHAVDALRYAVVMETRGPTLEAIR